MVTKAIKRVVAETRRFAGSLRKVSNGSTIEVPPWPSLEVTKVDAR